MGHGAPRAGRRGGEPDARGDRSRVGVVLGRGPDLLSRGGPGVARPRTGVAPPRHGPGRAARPVVPAAGATAGGPGGRPGLALISARGAGLGTTRGCVGPLPRRWSTASTPGGPPPARRRRT